MITAICQHSGLEFEASSKRTKQHPNVAALKSTAYDNGNYAEVMQALDTVKERGGYKTIEEYLDLVNEIASGKVTASRDARKREREEKAQREEARREHKRQRDAQNNILRRNGYNWRKIHDQEDEHYEDGQWLLFSPDGRSVSVEQALAEIEFIRQEKIEVPSLTRDMISYRENTKNGERYNLDAFTTATSFSDEQFGQAVDWNDAMDVIAENVANIPATISTPRATDGIDNYTEEQLADLGL